ncbi:hypothetical protein [Mycolicibacterium arenosum]|uniref:Uncharacterized protein n=1 Tax=Mycolicibacterium arenosum TaxID=2952157 RepID=A0ABT1LXC9_9MYCO|nr:hypothetical protein [Mycolicibacterium sp. CAU 1645]MCP9271543.1 hypothetical protein [Mycolicibacterium sp. CAU 1645]
MCSAIDEGDAGSAAVDGRRAASLLQSSRRGREVIGDLAPVAPPVIGEVDPHGLSDIELRI